MKLKGRIDERGLTCVFSSPETAPAEIGARLDRVERGLAALERVCLPLALEVERASLDSETGMVREPPPEPPVVWFVAPELPEYVLISPTVAVAPAPVRGSLAPKALRERLARLMERAPGAITDWRRIEALATAARGRPSAESLGLEQLPSRTLPPHRGSFFAGPLEGWRSFPPIAFRFELEGGVVRLRLTAHWSPWIDAGTEERGYFDDALAALAHAEFSVET